MELLIPGLILVALMVYASTRIKKTAAAAFDAETIETDAYTLQKPEGFLHVAGSTEHDFEAYSKEYGTNDSARVRRGTIEVDVFQDEDEVRRSLEASTVGEPIMPAADVETDEAANGAAIKSFYKILTVGDKAFRLRFSVLAEHLDEYLRSIEETLDSFTIISK